MNAPVPEAASKKEALQAPAVSAVDNRLQSFGDLEAPLRNAQVWASLLEKVVDDMARWPSMSKRELSVAFDELEFVTEPLKEAIDNLDTIYHQRTKEEAA
jgi:hypothetical protein